jgi:rhodanese-related sulfurtransferase
MFDFLRKLFGGVDIKPILERGATLIDVRSPSEFQSGSVKGSKNIPLQELGKNISQIQKMKMPIVVFCASGMRSAAAAKQLKSKGIEAYNGGTWRKVNTLLQK